MGLFVARAERGVCTAWRMRGPEFLFKAFSLCSSRPLKAPQRVLASLKARTSMALLEDQHFTGCCLVQNVRQHRASCTLVPPLFKRPLSFLSSASTNASDDGCASGLRGRLPCAVANRACPEAKVGCAVFGRNKIHPLEEPRAHLVPTAFQGTPERLGLSPQLYSTAQTWSALASSLTRCLSPQTPNPVSLERDIVFLAWRRAVRQRAYLLSNVPLGCGALALLSNPQAGTGASLDEAQGGGFLSLRRRDHAARLNPPTEFASVVRNRGQLEGTAAVGRALHTAAQVPGQRTQSQAALQHGDAKTKRSSDERRTEGEASSEMTWREIMHVFGFAALPMVGFGLMDQLIMIRLGDVSSQLSAHAFSPQIPKFQMLHWFFMRCSF